MFWRPHNFFFLVLRKKKKARQVQILLPVQYFQHLKCRRLSRLPLKPTLVRTNDFLSHIAHIKNKLICFQRGRYNKIFPPTHEL